MITEEQWKESHEQAEELRKIFKLPELVKHSYNLERCTSMGKMRCNMIKNDGDYNHQCNFALHHEGKHAFGLDSILWEYCDPNEPQCTEEDHVGTCSVCWVKKSRERHYDD